MKRKKSKKEPPYGGVTTRPWDRFAAEIRDPAKKSRIWLGTFDTAEEAARAYDNGTRRLLCPKAKSNFPISTSSSSPSPCLAKKNQSKSLHSSTIVQNPVVGEGSDLSGLSDTCDVAEPLDTSVASSSSTTCDVVIRYRRGDMSSHDFISHLRAVFAREESLFNKSLMKLIQFQSVGSGSPRLPKKY